MTNTIGYFEAGQCKRGKESTRIRSGLRKKTEKKQKWKERSLGQVAKEHYNIIINRKFITGGIQISQRLRILWFTITPYWPSLVACFSLHEQFSATMLYWHVSSKYFITHTLYKQQQDKVIHRHHSHLFVSVAEVLRKWHHPLSECQKGSCEIYCTCHKSCSHCMTSAS